MPLLVNTPIHVFSREKVTCRELLIPSWGRCPRPLPTTDLPALLSYFTACLKMEINASGLSQPIIIPQPTQHLRMDVQKHLKCRLCTSYCSVSAVSCPVTQAWETKQGQPAGGMAQKPLLFAFCPWKAKWCHGGRVKAQESSLWHWHLSLGS